MGVIKTGVSDIIEVTSSVTLGFIAYTLFIFVLGMFYVKKFPDSSYFMYPQYLLLGVLLLIIIRNFYNK